MDIWGGSKKIVHTPPQNILEGNGVVYRNLTFNSLLLQVFTSYYVGTVNELTSIT